MAQYPSTIAVTLALKRITRGQNQHSETLREGLKEALKIAFEYDVPKVIQTVYKDLNGITITYEAAKNILRQLNG